MIDHAGDLVSDRVPAAVRDGSQSFNKLREAQRDRRPLSKSGRSVRSSWRRSHQAASPRTTLRTTWTIGVSGSDIDIERRSDGGSKDEAQDHTSEQKPGPVAWRSRLDCGFRHRPMSHSRREQMAAGVPAYGCDGPKSRLRGRGDTKRADVRNATPGFLAGYAADRSYLRIGVGWSIQV